MVEQEDILRILLVDDDHAVLSGLTAALAVDDVDEERFQIDVVDGCEAALDEIMAGPFDLIMVADPVGELAGVEVLKDILHSGYAAPIVLVTARGDARAQAAALAAGATDYVERGRYSADLLERLVRYGRDHSRLLQLLEHTRRCYRTAVRQETVGSFTWDLSSRQIRFGAGFKAQLGYTDDELPDDPEAWFNRLLPADAQRLRHAIRRLVSGAAEIQELELRVQRRDRGYLWVRVRAAIEQDQAGQRRIVGTQKDIHATKLAEQRISWAEAHDGLTGLLRRGPFLEAADRHIQGLTGGATGGVLCLCDVDDMKGINSRFGRAAGDEALLWLAGLLEDRLSDNEQLARIAGDKFAFLLADGDLPAATDLARAMQAELAGEVFVAADDREFHVSASFVLAPLPSVVHEAGRWLELADLRMVDARRLGRSLVVLQPDKVTQAMSETRPVQRVSLRPRKNTLK